MKLRDAMAAGDIKGEANVVFHLILESGKEYNQQGKLDMSKQVVSETTGTFIIRVLFPNPDRIVLPGMYVRATVELGAEAGYTLPQLATSRDANGRLTAQFVSADGKVETRAFESSSPSNNSPARDRRHQGRRSADRERPAIDHFRHAGEAGPDEDQRQRRGRACRAARGR